MIINIEVKESTTIKHITYDRKIEELFGDLIVTFVNNKIYKYDKVHLKDFLQLISNTVSIGSPFSNCIKNRYKSKQITNNKENNNENIN